jgi:PGF-CTERM protein
MKSTMKLIIASVVLVAVLAVPAMALRGPTYKVLNNTDVAFVYETGLTMPPLDATHTATQLVKFANDNPDSSVAGGGQQLAIIPCDSPGVCSIYNTPPYLGIWFPWNSTYNGGTSGNVSKAVYIQIQHADVTLDAVLNASHSDSIAGKSVTRDTLISFKLNSNYAGNFYKWSDMVGAGNVTYAALVNIELTTPGGGKIQIFGNSVTDLRSITLIGSQEYTDSLTAAQSQWIPSVIAGTQSPAGEAIDLTGVEAGTYTATAKWVQTNPAIGNVTTPWYNYEANSNSVTFTVLSKPITITTNKETVVRGNSFVVTVTGESKKAYWLYMKDSSITSGNTYPQMALGQSNVNLYPPASASSPLGVNLSMVTDVNPAYSQATNNLTAANITTAADGTRAIQFDTTSLTYDTKYTVKVIDPVDLSKYDTVDVTVTKGQVTITYEGTGTYYLGETIKLSGTNTDSDTVYLYLVGPNLDANGDNIVTLAAVVDGTAASFKSVSVNTDNTWSYKWDTSALPKTIDAGTYTVYAAAEPHWKANLTNTQYATASVVLKKPFVTASVSTNTLAQGDILYIQGTAEGTPTSVDVWIFGKNYRSCSNGASVKSDASYQYKLDRGDTSSLYAGQYFAVVQHPMMNGIFDVQGDKTGLACNFANVTPSGTWKAGNPSIKITGLQASDAATALVDLLNSPNVDDTYTKLSFMVEAPWVRIDTIGDHYVGDTFSITGTTNLAEGDQIQMTVVSSSFKPTEKTQAGEFSGASGTVTVQKGETYNTFSFSVDASSFKPDEYLVTAESIEPSQSTTATFNILEAAPTTAATTAPATVVTTAAATTVPATVATTVPTTTAKPQPGFGVLISLVGLGAVALLVLRRR